MNSKTLATPQPPLGKSQAASKVLTPTEISSVQRRFRCAGNGVASVALQSTILAFLKRGEK